MSRSAVRPMRRVLVRVILAVLALSVLLLFAGGWFFSGQIRAGALDVHAGSDQMTLRIVTAAAGSVTLEETGVSQRPLRRDATFGLAWETGYGQVSGRASVDGTRVTRHFVLLAGSPPTSAEPARLEREAFPDDDPAAALGGPVHEVTYASPGGRFAAWFSPGAGTTWAILLHGQRAGRAEVLRAMAVTTAAGLPSLAISYRNDAGAPQDPSHFYGFGSSEWRDLEGAVRYALHHGARHVLLAGNSMGAGIVASFLRESELQSRVSAVVFDSPMLDLGATVDHQAAQRRLPVLGVPLPGPLTWTAKQLAALRYDVDWGELDYLADSTWLDVPTLVFHGTDDSTVPLASSQQLRRAHPDLVHLVAVDGAEHVASWNEDPDDYERELREFLLAHR